MVFKPGQSGNPTGKGGFKKGQSGNPGGRSKSVGLVQELFRLDTDEMREGLLKLIRGKNTPPAVRLSAITAYLDRGWGRPAQVIDATINKKPLDEMSDAELMEIAAGIEDTTPPAKTH